MRMLFMWLLCGGLASAETPPSLPDRIDTWMQSVVLLVTGPAWCTGVVIDDQGTIATAYHCIASGQRTEVRTRGGDVFIAKTIAGDPMNDIALISAPEIMGVAPPMEIRVDPPRQGESVYGLGHPFAPAAGRTITMEGMLQWSVTSGIVSAVGPRLIQTDAALNPGNSGGPVVDGQGRIVGITSRKLGGDNIAFLSASSNLIALQKSLRKLSPLGGFISLGISNIVPMDLQASQSILLTISAVFRDRVVFTGGLALGSDARQVALERGSAWYPAYEMTTALRQRLGRGIWSTALEAGGGLFGSNAYYSSFDATQGRFSVLPGTGELGVIAFGRVAAGGLGLRVAYLPNGRDGLISDDRADAARAVAIADGTAFSGPEMIISIDMDVLGVLRAF